MEMFKGYPRVDGSVGIRNHVVITSTVACSNGSVLRVAEENPGLISMCTVNGCGNSHDSLEYHRAVANICRHPNVYAVILIGLGCEDMDAKVLADELAAEGRNVFVRRVQHDGGSDVVCKEASEAAKRFLKEAAEMEPVDCPIEKLAVGFRFVNEDVNTDVYTNPVFGKVVDWFVDHNATAVVSQTGAYFGGEKFLAEKAGSEAAEKKLHEIYSNTAYQMEKYYGNRDFFKISEAEEKLGITTPAERAAARLSVMGKYDISHVIDAEGRLGDYKGLVFQDGTMIDTAGLNALLTAGTQLSVVSSGRLSLLGWPAAPVLKVATNQDAFCMSPGDMDLDAAAVAEGKQSTEAFAQDIIRKIIAVANGQKTVAEEREHDGGVFETHFRKVPHKRDNITEILDFC